MCVCVFVCVFVCVCECLCVCSIGTFLSCIRCNLFLYYVDKDLTVRTTSTNTRAQQHVEMVSLSIQSYSLGGTHCVAIYRFTTYTSEP